MNYGFSGFQRFQSKWMRILHYILKLLLPGYKIDWQKYVQKTYILHLPDRSDRKSKLSKQLKNIKTKQGSLLDHVTWWNGFKGRKSWSKKIHEPFYSFFYHWIIDPDPKYRHIPVDVMKSQMVKCSLAESNIALGHHSILFDFVNSKEEVALILEDDVHFRYNIQKKIKDIFENQLPADWDIVYLSSLPGATGFTWDPHSKDLLRLYNGVWWLSGILISKKGANKLLNNLPIVGPIDVWINHQFEGMKVYMAEQNLIEQTGQTKSDNTYSFVHNYGY